MTDQQLIQHLKTTNESIVRQLADSNRKVGALQAELTCMVSRGGELPSIQEVKEMYDKVLAHRDIVMALKKDYMPILVKNKVPCKDLQDLVALV